MAFEGLTEKLSAAFKKLRGKGRLSEADVKEAMREIRLALLEADVSYKVVKQFIAQVTEKAVGSDVLEALSPAPVSYTHLLGVLDGPVHDLLQQPVKGHGDHVQKFVIVRMALRPGQSPGQIEVQPLIRCV